MAALSLVTLTPRLGSKNTAAVGEQEHTREHRLRTLTPSISHIHFSRDRHFTSVSYVNPAYLALTKFSAGQQYSSEELSRRLFTTSSDCGNRRLHPVTSCAQPLTPPPPRQNPAVIVLKRLGLTLSLLNKPIQAPQTNMDPKDTIRINR